MIPHHAPLCQCPITPAVPPHQYGHFLQWLLQFQPFFPLIGALTAIIVAIALAFIGWCLVVWLSRRTAKTAEVRFEALIRTIQNQGRTEELTSAVANAVAEAMKGGFTDEGQ